MKPVTKSTPQPTGFRYEMRMFVENRQGVEKPNPRIDQLLRKMRAAKLDYQQTLGTIITGTKNVEMMFSDIETRQEKRGWQQFNTYSPSLIITPARA